MKPPHRLVLTELWRQIDRLDETLARVEAPSQASCGPGAEAAGLLATMPGLARHTAELPVAELGPDMTCLPIAAHAAARPLGAELNAPDRRRATRRAVDVLGRRQTCPLARQ